MNRQGLTFTTMELLYQNPMSTQILARYGQEPKVEGDLGKPDANKHTTQ